MLNEILRKLASLKQKVQKGSNYDKRNVADEVRGVKANQVMLAIKRRIDAVLGTENDELESDLNQASSLEVGALNFISKAKNQFTNLLTLSIIKTATIEAAVDEEQLIDFDAVPDAGLWSVSFGAESTSDLAFNANAAAVQAALRLIEGLEDVTVTGDYTAGFTVVFAGVAGGTDQPLLVEDTNTLEAAAVPVVITITEEVAGEAGVDTTGVIVDNNDIKIYCASAATNTEVKALVDASAQASALITTTIDAGQGAVSATAALNKPFSGGA